MRKFLLIFLSIILIPQLQAAEITATSCINSEIDVVVLGSGGPELTDRRASTGYLLREKGKARFIIDFGAGASLNFERVGGKIEDLEALLFTHFHVDHVNDLPAIIKASFFSDRERDLPLYGPTGNHIIPSTSVFVERQFGVNGVYPYLSDFLTGEAVYRLIPIEVNADHDNPRLFTTKIGDFSIQAIGVDHGLLPSLAWRIEKDGCSLVISGDTNNSGKTLEHLAKTADIFIAHHAVPESSKDHVAQHLHMKPSEIGRISRDSKVHHLLLSHFMHRTEHTEDETQSAIRSYYNGPLDFAKDCDIYQLQTGKKIGSCM
ncbi:ribonuclease BN (tRNA processing enzyme) [Bisgaardia hudsonensis]|uniref:Ribonuclease BN (tRNA processing enzyme) n=1 Tax=Bisgaardia hudsonensis TaxID=109472 RepID=A0A4R2MR01_9PAST|nr:MBL fold metallo-hydrolase [Bisgaardia hudsonensis]QLB13558.1 arylsulfatase [Bisgaardia hudsonensis]TCP10882.1 ribonuclease BN (tRNA processing enzyme) [Bisgaardia hudsonensis]